MTRARSVGAHLQPVTNRYAIYYPEHPPREGDPHYRDFHAYHEATRSDPTVYHCSWAAEVADTTACVGLLELHHSHIEFALTNAVDLAHLEHVYPGVSDPAKVGAWVETAANLVWLCARHHRAADAGVHHLSASDYEGSKFLTAGTIRKVAA